MEFEKGIDDITTLLLYMDEHSILPELYGAFDLQVLKKLIDVFGGTTIKIPSRNDFARTMRDVNIYKRLIGPGRDKNEDYGATVRQLAGYYSLSESRVRDIASEVGRKLVGIQKRKSDWTKRLLLDINAMENECEQ
jgi:Mor family transcriptional regulator